MSKHNIKLLIKQFLNILTGNNGGRCANKTSAILPAIALGPPLPSHPCSLCSKSLTKSPCACARGAINESKI